MSTRRWVLTPRTTGGFALAVSLSLAACLGNPDEPALARRLATLTAALLAAATLLELNRQTRRQLSADEEHRHLLRIEAARVDATKEAEREALMRVAEHAQTQAEAANLVKDEFLSILSHELRSPLHAMLGWLAILKKGVASGRNVERAVETIERNVKLQAQLVNDLLDVSRIVSDQLVIEEEPVDLAVVVQAAVEDARAAAATKGVELSCSVSPPPGPVLGDEKRLHQMVGCLLANAIKFTPSGGRVSVTLVTRGAEATLQIADTGDGIAPEFLPRVFDRFRQANASSTRTHGGLGLGLAIVKTLAELHGGDVEARSEGAGRGSTFAVRVPLRPAPREPPPVETTEPQGELDGITLLLLEDDPDGREALRIALEQTGAQVYAGGSAAEGRQIMEEVTPDVIVSDIGMPGENGYEFLRTVRAKSAAHTPAIAITGFASKQDREEAVRSGFDEHVAKPVNVDVLLGKLRDLVRRSGAGRPPARPLAAPLRHQTAGSSPPSAA